MNKDDLLVGQRVHYLPDFGIPENGIVKRLSENGAFVVYNCNGEWDRLEDYTAANTNARDLRPGWTVHARNKKFCPVEHFIEK